MTKKLKTTTLVLCALIASPFVYAAEEAVTLVSYIPDLVVEKVDPSEDETDDSLYSPPPEELLRELDGELELLVFTVKEPGVCGACDRARPQWRELEAEYPITPIYCSMSSKPKVRGDLVAREYNVRSFPTFVLVRRCFDGSADEVARWSGCGSFFESTAKRIKREFADAFFEPRKPKPGFVPPPRRPRPVPGLRPPKRDEPPRPRQEPKPGRKPGSPRISFEVDALC